MKAFVIRHKKLLFILAILLLLYLAIPMMYQGKYPGKLFELDADQITAIELHDEYGQFITIEDPEEIASLTEQLNSRRYWLWRFDGPLTGCSYGMTIYKGNQTESYTVEPNYVEDGLLFYTDMTFITDYFAEG